MIKVCNSGTLTGVTVSDLSNNLRLPSGFDAALLQVILDASVNLIETTTGRCMIDKTVTQVFIDNPTLMYLKYPANCINHVMINNEYLDTEKYTTVLETTPSAVWLVDRLYGANTVVIEYDCKGEVTPALRNLVMAIGSQYYNNPEGLGAIDQSRINMMLNMHLNMI